MRKSPKFSFSEMDALIGEYITGKNAKRDREILRSYFLDGESYEVIAERAGMSANQIGRIIRSRGDPLLLRIVN